MNSFVTYITRRELVNIKRWNLSHRLDIYMARKIIFIESIFIFIAVAINHRLIFDEILLIRNRNIKQAYTF